MGLPYKTKCEIKRDGSLWADVGDGESVMKCCPFLNRPVSGQSACGHWCSLFGPINIYSRGHQNRPDLIELELCHGKKLIFDEFEDKRCNYTNREED